MNKIGVVDGELEVWTERDEKLHEDRRRLCMDFLTRVLNQLLLIHPIEYREFNKILVMDTDLQERMLLALEETFPQVGVTEVDGKLAFTTLSLIATITDILVGDRLAFLFHDRIADGGKMYACEWYYRDSVPRQNFLNWICGYPGRTEESG